MNLTFRLGKGRGRRKEMEQKDKRGRERKNGGEKKEKGKDESRTRRIRKGKEEWRGNRWIKEAYEFYTLTGADIRFEITQDSSADLTEFK